jgi:Leucine-rich repeat (LRR) protein
MMFIYLMFGCGSNGVKLMGNQPAAGDSSHFIQSCRSSDKTAMSLVSATGKAGCEAAWERLSTVTNIDFTNAEDFSTLHAIRGMTNLRVVTAYDNGISDLEPLSQLLWMEELYLLQNDITDLSSLHELTQLKVLRVDGNNISDITILSSLKKLEKLGLDDNQIEDFRPILELEYIQALNTNKNPVKMEYCPIDENKGPKQLRKYCKRMKKHFSGIEDDNLQDAIDPKSPSPID